MQATSHIKTIGALALLLLIAGNVCAGQNAVDALVSVSIYSTETARLLGVSKLKQAPSVADVQVVDLSIIPQMEAMFSAHANNQMNQQSIAELKALGAQLSRLQLQKLASAQMDFFELQTRYDVTIADLPIVVFEQGKASYLYKGNDAYQGFLLWQQSKR